MSSKIKVIVETLAKDGTNPEVNKKAIVELGNEADAIPNVEAAEDGTIDKALGLNASNKLVKGVIPNVESAQAGTIDKALGLDASGKLVKGDFPSGSGYAGFTVVSNYTPFKGIKIDGTIVSGRGTFENVMLITCTNSSVPSFGYKGISLDTGLYVTDIISNKYLLLVENVSIYED